MRVSARVRACACVGDAVGVAPAQGLDVEFFVLQKPGAEPHGRTHARTQARTQARARPPARLHTHARMQARARAVQRRWLRPSSSACW
jgi:hypothetical protein